MWVSIGIRPEGYGYDEGMYVKLSSVVIHEEESRPYTHTHYTLMMMMTMMMMMMMMMMNVFVQAIFGRCVAPN